MLFASSKAALKHSLTGLVDEYQATDRSDLNLADIQKKAGHV
jgi:cofilin